MKTTLVLIACLAAAAGPGCTHNQLKRSTTFTQRSMSDLRFKHMLDNLALMVRNPAAVPNPVVISGGVVQVSDNGAGTGDITDIFPFGLFSAGRTVSEQWSLSPLQNAQKLALMRCVFQVLLNSDLQYEGTALEQLQEALGGEDLCEAIPRGWFHVGRKRDVPRAARYCGNYSDTYVWVMDDGLDDFSHFYLTMMRLYQLEFEKKTATVTRTYEGGPEEGALSQTVVQTVEELPLSNQPTPSKSVGEFPVTGQGLQFIPTAR
ncbi:MAG: hypothetical protein DWH79_03165 [Planctomycetota bacterium]|nr:MAG: hypothetical protein DWH79_03165 [Planctomycetota bacterium]